MAAKYEVLDVPSSGLPQIVWCRVVRALYRADDAPTGENVTVVSVIELRSGDRVVEVEHREAAPPWDDPASGPRTDVGVVMHGEGARVLADVFAEAAAVAAVPARGSLPALPRKRPSDVMDVQDFGDVAA